jgi:hypothetical protein
LANSVGFRYGDNYTSIGDNHKGFLTVSNSFSLYNYRDIFGWTWSDWRYRNESMNIHDNFITQSNSYHPNNTLWNPLVEGYRLAAFMTTPEDAPVGIGIASWNGQSPIADISNGVPVRLSSFTTQPVSVDYTFQSATGAALQNGTLTFNPGETVKRIPVNATDPQNHELIRVSLSNPVRCELTGDTHYYFVKVPVNTTLVSRGSVWKYHNLGQDLGTDWRQPNFVDNAWNSGPADIGFGDPGIPTVITGGPSGGRFPTIYFRRAFTLNDVTGIGQLQIGLRRDDGGVVYLNNQEIFRSNMPNGPITYNTFTPGSTPDETTFFQGTTNSSALVVGQNVLAVEIHQSDVGSSDLHFDFELIGLPGSSTPELKFAKFGSDLLLYWTAPSFHLEETTALGGSWTPHPGQSPVEIQTTQPRQFFRLRN